MQDSDVLFFEQATLAAGWSRCLDVEVGAVIVKDNVVVSVGSNGSPILSHSCKRLGFCYEGVERCTSSDKPSVAIHAEAAAIAHAARNGVPINGATMYVTHQPCINCLKLIIGAGISEIAFFVPFANKDAALWDLLVKESGILVRRVQLVG